MPGKERYHRLARARSYFWKWIYREARRRVADELDLPTMAQEEVDKMLRERLRNLEEQGGKGFVALIMADAPPRHSRREQRNVRLQRSRR